MATPPECPKCTSRDLLVVNLTPNDVPMRFSTCRHCEHRWWEDAHVGADMALSSVIANIAG